MLGKTVGSYEVTQKLGEGGMGAVYLARHTLLGRRAAVKVLLPEFSQNQVVVTRFFNEAKAATAIDHPGIIDVFDFGYDQEGHAYLAMTYLDGESLSDRLKECGVVSGRRVVTLGKQIASALDAAHKRGIVHRDLKPDNIMLVPDPDIEGGERVKVLDFGIAKLTDAAGLEPMHKTRTGSVMGTPKYMAPEQCRGVSGIDHRADIYSLGCLLYELACGCPPFSGEGAGDLFVAHIATPPPAPRSIVPELSPALELLLLQLLAKDPDARPQSMADVGEALAAIEAGDEIPVRAAQFAADSAQTLAASETSERASTSGVVERAVVAEPSATRTGVSSGSRLWLVLAAGLALAAGGVSVFLASSSEKTAAATFDAAPEQPALMEADSPVLPEPASEEPSASIELVIASTPEGADVFRAFDGVRLGKTPMSRSLRRTEGELKLILRKEGFADGTLLVNASEDYRGEIALVPKEESPRRPVRERREPERESAPERPTSAKPPAERPQAKEPERSEPTRPTTRRPIKDGTIDPFPL